MFFQLHFRLCIFSGPDLHPIGADTDKNGNVYTGIYGGGTVWRINPKYVTVDFNCLKVASGYSRLLNIFSERRLLSPLLMLALENPLVDARLVERTEIFCLLPLE